MVLSSPTVKRGEKGEVEIHSIDFISLNSFIPVSKERTDLHLLNRLATYGDGLLAGFFNLMWVSVRYMFLDLTHCKTNH